MGIDNTRYFGVAATAATVLMMAQTVTLVAIGLLGSRESRKPQGVSPPRRPAT